MPEPRFFSLDYIERQTLRDGTKIYLRLLRPDDKELLRAGFNQLSPEARYARFLSPKAALSDDELRYLCEIDQEQHFAICALRDLGDGSDPAVGLGVARFIRLSDPPNTAEAAITVVDQAQQKGLGTLLFLRLVAAAAERGVLRFRCEVLVGNTGMAALIEQIDPDRTIEAGDGVMSIELVLPSITPTQPPTEETQQSSMYRLFRAVAQNAVVWTDAVRKLWRR
jgi:RimJ/RimL family protein N-acetyltransferase